MPPPKRRRHHEHPRRGTRSCLRSAFARVPQVRRGHAPAPIATGGVASESAAPGGRQMAEALGGAYGNFRSAFGWPDAAPGECGGAPPGGGATGFSAVGGLPGAGGVLAGVWRALPPRRRGAGRARFCLPGAPRSRGAPRPGSEGPAGRHVAPGTRRPSRGFPEPSRPRPQLLPPARPPEGGAGSRGRGMAGGADVPVPAADGSPTGPPRCAAPPPGPPLAAASPAAPFGA